MLMVVLNGAASLIALASLLAIISMSVAQRWRQIAPILRDGAALSAGEAAQPSLRWRLAA